MVISQVVLIEPHFDSYSVVVEVAGGKPVYVALKPGTGLITKHDLYSRPPQCCRFWDWQYWETSGVATKI